jgi:hypothetical protein
MVLPGCGMNGGVDSAASRFDGRWHGILGDGADTIRFVIDLRAAPGGGWLAEADIPAEGVGDLPLIADARGDSLFLRLSHGKEAETWRGKRTSDGRIHGVYSRRGTDSPLTLGRVGEAEISAKMLALRTEPPGSRRVLRLSPDGRELREAFNAGKARTRLVALLSPT